MYFLRHGVAHEPDEWRGDDFDRPLTDEGTAKMERQAKALAKLNLGLDAILTSPLVRARQTADIVAQAMGMAAQTDDRLGPSFGVPAVAAILRERPRASALMLVGHEPNFSATIGTLTGGAQLALKKGGLACVDLRDGSNRGDLTMLVPPKFMRAAK